MHARVTNMQGFQRVSNNIDDTCLDAPKAKDVFQKQIAAAVSGGWLDPDWDQSTPGSCATVMLENQVWLS